MPRWAPAQGRRACSCAATCRTTGAQAPPSSPQHTPCRAATPCPGATACRAPPTAPPPDSGTPPANAARQGKAPGTYSDKARRRATAATVPAGRANHRPFPGKSPAATPMLPRGKAPLRPVPPAGAAPPSRVRQTRSPSSNQAATHNAPGSRTTPAPVPPRAGG